ncbi:MAG: ABC transporter ATP-binding protein [Candidatus Norongarragalinales archaeon]
MKLLECESLSKYFGKFAALKDLSFSIDEGIIFGIAGPNGAGKTTLINVISGLYPLTTGKIRFLDKYIHNTPPHRRCQLGIARTFQIPTYFPNLTVEENVLVGVTFGAKKQDNVEKRVMDVLEFTWLLEKKDAIAENLSLYEKKRLMLAVALATEPKLLMLDEPIAGLNPNEINESMKLIKTINNNGVTIIIIEHVMRVLMGLSDRVMILNQGEKLAEGSPNEIAKDEKVIKTYLGEKY